MFAAHIKKDGKIQTVKEHSIGVKEYADIFASELDIKNILTIAADLHDSGKLCIDFNEYINGENNFSRGKIDHSFSGAKFIIEFAKEFNDRNILETANLIARIIISHHGLHDWINDDCEDYLKKRSSKSDRYDEIYKNILCLIDKSKLESALIEASKEYKIIKDTIYKISNKKQEDFAFYFGMFERYAQSILVDSDRTDTAKFMNDIIPKLNNEKQLQNLWNKMCDNIENMCIEFGKNTSPINKQRMSISDRCLNFIDKPRGICNLIVPTGGGKTISSFRFAANYCRKYTKKKIFYLAPFMSILEQNADVIKSIVQDDDMFLEHHSNILSEIEDDEEFKDYKIKCDRWEASVIATTMVQFLNSLFDGKMSSVRRFHLLSNSVIIIDEIQSLPVKCVYLFNLAMNFLSKICGSTIVLCSATQPDLQMLKHPVIFDEEQSMTGDFQDDFAKFKRTELIFKLLKGGYDSDSASDFAYEKYLENKNLLIILNTKKSAAEIYDRLKTKIENDINNKTEIFLLSTLMCPKAREDKLSLIKKLLAENKPVICVTTQLIEAGVDISFNCVIRALAGLDSIAQAAGRCNRNGENEISPVYVININNENLRLLKEIEVGKEISAHINSVSSSNLFNDDIIKIYFKKFYTEFENWLQYPLKEKNHSILDFLSLNRNRQMSTVKSPYAQAFKTAGDNFEVIEEKTKSILVPHDEISEEIILDLNSNIELSEKAKLLRKAQKYVVNVYSDLFNQLFENNQIFPICDKEIFVLKKEYYDESFLIKNENTKMALCIF